MQGSRKHPLPRGDVDTDVHAITDPVRELGPGAQRFVDHFVTSMNAREAARRAGYADDARASRALMRRDEVRAAIRYRMRQISEETMIEASRVVQELASIAFSNLYDMIVFDQPADDIGEEFEEEPARTLPRFGVLPRLRLEGLSRVEMASIKKIKLTPSEHGDRVEVELHDKSQALEKLMRYLGMIDERGRGSGAEALTDEEIERELRAVDAEIIDLQATADPSPGTATTDAPEGD